MVATYLVLYFQIFSSTQIYFDKLPQLFMNENESKNEIGKIGWTKCQTYAVQILSILYL